MIDKYFRRHRSHEFLRFINEVDKAVPEEGSVEIHVVMDNNATCEADAVNRWFVRGARYHVHFNATGLS